MSALADMRAEEEDWDSCDWGWGLMEEVSIMALVPLTGEGDMDDRWGEPWGV